MIASALWAAAALAASAPCDALDTALADPWPEGLPQQVERIERALQALPGDSQALAGHVRELSADPETIAKAREALVAVARDACRPAEAASGAPADDVARLLETDPRFGGIRVGDDAIDRLFDRLFRWFTALFESEGMQRYAKGARFIYLTALVVGFIAVVLMVARRAWREAHAKSPTTGKDGDARARIDRQRQKAFAEMMAEARAALPHDSRRAALALRAALMARVGEQAPDAVTPARTSREVLARLPSAIAGTVRPPLDRFDAIVFGKDTTADDARALLADVESAERALSAPAVRAP